MRCVGRARPPQWPSKGKGLKESRPLGLHDHRAQASLAFLLVRARAIMRCRRATNRPRAQQQRPPSVVACEGRLATWCLAGRMRGVAALRHSGVRRRSSSVGSAALGSSRKRKSAYAAELSLLRRGMSSVVVARVGWVWGGLRSIDGSIDRVCDVLIDFQESVMALDAIRSTRPG